MAAVLAMTHAGAKGNTGLQIENSLHLTKFSNQKIWGVMGNLIRNVKVIKNSPIFVTTYSLRNVVKI